MIETVIELEKERIESENDNQLFLLWIAQSIGFLHACLHNSGMAGYKNPLTKNPAFEDAPERIKKLLGIKKEEKQYTDNELYGMFFQKKS